MIPHWHGRRRNSPRRAERGQTGRWLHSIYVRKHRDLGVRERDKFISYDDSGRSEDHRGVHRPKWKPEFHSKGSVDGQDGTAAFAIVHFSNPQSTSNVSVDVPLSPGSRFQIQRGRSDELETSVFIFNAIGELVSLGQLVMLDQVCRSNFSGLGRLIVKFIRQSRPKDSKIRPLNLSLLKVNIFWRGGFGSTREIFELKHRLHG